MFREANNPCNLQFAPNGVRVTTFFASQTVWVDIFFGKDLFNIERCTEIVTSTLNLQEFVKVLQIHVKMKSKKLVFKDKENSLYIIGIPDDKSNQLPSTAFIKCELYAVQNLDTSVYKYKIFLRFDAKAFAKQIECMSTVFSIHIHPSRPFLQFTSVSDLGGRKLSLHIDNPNIMRQIREDPELNNYRASFLRTYLTPIVKGSRICKFITISFLRGEHPLFVQFEFNVSNTLEPDNNSVINMFFCSRVDDDETE